MKTKQIIFAECGWDTGRQEPPFIADRVAQYAADTINRLLNSNENLRDTVVLLANHRDALANIALKICKYGDDLLPTEDYMQLEKVIDELRITGYLGECNE